MIAFLESGDIKEIIESSKSFEAIDSVLNKYEKKIKLKDKLSHYKLLCDEYKNIRDYKAVYLSSHDRIKNPIAIAIYHIVLDYNHIILK